MKKYKVEITETLQKIVEVEADNKEDAMHKVMKMYKIQKLYQMKMTLLIWILRVYNCPCGSGTNNKICINLEQT